MTPETNKIPEWARQERGRDFEWIGKNLIDFWPLARDAFKDIGRGVIIVDTTSQSTGKGHPYGYFSKEDIAGFDDEDTNRMLQNYDPDREFVILLIKSGDRTSTYRIQPTRPGEK